MPQWRELANEMSSRLSLLDDSGFGPYVVAIVADLRLLPWSVCASFLRSITSQDWLDFQLCCIVGEDGLPDVGSHIGCEFATIRGSLTILGTFAELPDALCADSVILMPGFAEFRSSSGLRDLVCMYLHYGVVRPGLDVIVCSEPYLSTGGGEARVRLRDILPLREGYVFEDLLTLDALPGGAFMVKAEAFLDWGELDGLQGYNLVYEALVKCARLRPSYSCNGSGVLISQEELFNGGWRWRSFFDFRASAMWQTHKSFSPRSEFRTIFAHAREVQEFLSIRCV